MGNIFSDDADENINCEKDENNPRDEVQVEKDIKKHTKQNPKQSTTKRKKQVIKQVVRNKSKSSRRLGFVA